MIERVAYISDACSSTCVSILFPTEASFLAPRNTALSLACSWDLACRKHSINTSIFIIQNQTYQNIVYTVTFRVEILSEYTKHYYHEDMDRKTIFLILTIFANVSLSEAAFSAHSTALLSWLCRVISRSLASSSSRCKSIIFSWALLDMVNITANNKSILCMHRTDRKQKEYLTIHA